MKYDIRPEITRLLNLFGKQKIVKFSSEKYAEPILYWRGYSLRLKNGELRKNVEIYDE